MSDENFKIRVAEILRDYEGETSEAFGVIGQEFKVVDGVLTDLESQTWEGFEDFEHLRKEFENNVYYRVRFEKVPEFPSFKVIVTENKKKYGCGDSIKWFGDVGTVLSVVDGELIDLQGFNWTNNCEKYNNVEDINSHLKEVGGLGVEFRLYEGDEVQKPSVELYNGRFKVVRNIGNRSSEVIGNVGEIIEVVDGSFKAKTNNEWSRYKDFQAIKNHLSETDCFETVIEEVSETYYSGKFRVAKNIGKLGLEYLGDIGSIIEVKNGSFYDKKNNHWTNRGLLFKTFKDIQEYFSEIDTFQTILEEVVEEPILPTLIKDMTIEEIEKELGYEIRIVSSKKGE